MGMWGTGGTIVIDDDLPFPQREDLMSLDTVRAKDTLRGEVFTGKDELLSLKTRDIAGAKPFRRVAGQNRLSYAHGCVHPRNPGGATTTRYPPVDSARRPRDLSLTTSDLPGAEPKDPNLNIPGSRVVDPVVPLYRMFASAAAPPTPTKASGREPLDVSDIDGASSKVRPPVTHEHDPNYGADICSARGPKLPPQSARDAERSTKQRLRRTDPIDPLYQWHAPEGVTSLPAAFEEYQGDLQGGPQAPLGETKAMYGHIDRSRSKNLTWQHGEPQLSLVSVDIEGAMSQRRVGQFKYNIYGEAVNYPFFHETKDIEGAQCDTLRRGFNRGTRCTDPLNPKYQEIGAAKLRELPLLDAERGGAISARRKVFLSADGRASTAPS